MDQYKKFANEHDNETLFKEGLSLLDDLDFIRVRPHEKAAVVKAFKDAGVTRLPDGRAIEDIITTTKEPPKARKQPRPQ